MCYEEGMGIGKDPDEALKCYKDAADGKYPPGMYNLGYLYLKKGKFINNHDQFFKATYWFRSALALDPKLKEAHYYLGFLYENGLGIDKDYHTAYSHYRKAADLKHAKACKRCGDFLYSGCGLLRTDRPEAFQYYTEACNLGDGEAYNARGLMYESGFEGTKKNIKMAFKDYKKSHEKGFTDGTINLALMYIQGSQRERDRDRKMER